MDILLNFISQYGIILGLIALVGVIGLAVMKYAGAFKKYDEQIRHYLYIGISAGFSIIASVIYLAITSQLTVAFVVALAPAIFALDQGFYAIIKNTPLNEFIKMVLEWVIKVIDK